MPHAADLTLTWTPRADETADAAVGRFQQLPHQVPVLVAVVLAGAGAAGLGSPLTLGVAVLSLFLAAALVRPGSRQVLARRRSAAMFAAVPVLGETCTATFTDEGFTVSGDRTYTRQPWSAFPSWCDLTGAVVLASSALPSARTVTVPHRAGSADDVARLRELLERHVGPATRPRRRPPRARLAAQLVVLLCVIGAPAWQVERVHADSGDWRLFVAQAPGHLTFRGAEYRRLGPVPEPDGTVGTSYTPGGGLVLVDLADSRVPDHLWVLAHGGVVTAYARR